MCPILPGTQFPWTLGVVRFFNWYNTEHHTINSSSNYNYNNNNKKQRGVAKTVIFARDLLAPRRSVAAATSSLLLPDACRRDAANVLSLRRDPHDAIGDDRGKRRWHASPHADLSRSILFEGFVKADLFRDLVASLRD